MDDFHIKDRTKGLKNQSLNGVFMGYGMGSFAEIYKIPNSRERINASVRLCTPS